MMLFFGIGGMKFRLLMVSLALIGTGAWMIAPTWNAKEKVDWDLSQMYYGRLPKSNWVRVSGRLLWDEAAEEESRRRGTTAYFVPLVPRSWNHGQPVQVFVRISTYEADEMQAATAVEGLIQPMGLPLDLQLIFSGDDGVKAGENAVYIHHGTDPIRQRQFAQVVLLIGIGGVIGFGVMCKFGGSADKETGYHSMAKARSLDEGVARTEEEQLQHLEREAQRESEIERWMRDHGIANKTPDAEEAAEACGVKASRV